MKFKSLIVFAAASVLAAIGCQKPVDLGPEKVEIKGDTTIEVPVEGKEVEFKFVSTVDWAVQADTYTAEVKKWLNINPTSGKASANEQVVKIKVLSNAGNTDRSATITIWGNIAAKANITIKQKGDKVVEVGEGTKEKPYSAKEANEKASKLSETEEIANVYVKGKVSQIKKWSIEQYGSVDYYISEDGTQTDQFYIYSGLNLGGVKFKSEEELKVGDEVIVKGTLINYRGNTPEFEKQNYIVSLNGKEVEEVDYTKAPEKTVAEFIKAADTQNYYKLTGTISGKYVNANNNHISFDLTDAAGDKIYVFSINNEDEYRDKIADGATVVLVGTYEYYENKKQHEVVKAVILSIEPGQGGDEELGEPAGTGTEADPYNVAAVITKYKESGVSDDKIFVKGIITGIKAMPANHNTADVYISDTEKGVKLLVYHLNNFGATGDGDGGFGESGLKEGDIVVIRGQIDEHGGNVQIGKAFLVSLNGETGGEGGGDTPTPEPGNDSSLENPWTASQAKAAAAALASGATIENVYVKGIISYIKSVDTGQYGNAEYHISDDGKRTNDFCIFRGYSINGEKFTSADEIKVSDTVILLGTITNFNGTPEMAQGSKILSLVPGEGGDTEEIPEGSVILSFPDDNSANNGLTTKQYESEWTAKSGDVEFAIYGFNNNKWGSNWAWIKCGRKSDASVATIINKTALPKLSKVVVTVDTIIDKGAEAINKAVLNVYSDAAKTTAVATDIEATDGFMQGDVAFEIPANLQAEGLYYELLIDCKAHGSKNGIVSIAKIVYTAAE